MVAELFHQLRWGVAYFLRNWQVAVLFHVFCGGAIRVIGTSVFRRLCQIHDSVGKVNPRFRQPNSFNGAKYFVSNHERGRLGHADVLGGKDDHAARNEFWVFARVNHAREIVERGIRLARSHTLNKGRDSVVVLLPFLIKPQKLVLHGVLERFDVDLLTCDERGRTTCGEQSRTI